MQQALIGFVFIMLFAATARAEDTALTPSEIANLRGQIAQCWNVGASKAAVTVSFELGRDGRPDKESLRLIEGDSGAAGQDAFSGAKRAILRFGAKGYKLPLAKYDQWQFIEMTFDPEGT